MVLYRYFLRNYFKLSVDTKLNISVCGFDESGTFFAQINRDDEKPPATRIYELIRSETQQDVNFMVFAITHDIPMSKEV